MSSSSTQRIARAKIQFLIFSFKELVQDTKYDYVQYICQEDCKELFEFIDGLQEMQPSMTTEEKELCAQAQQLKNALEEVDFINNVLEEKQKTNYRFNSGLLRSDADMLSENLHLLLDEVIEPELQPTKKMKKDNKDEIKDMIIQIIKKYKLLQVLAKAQLILSRNVRAVDTKLEAIRAALESARATALRF